MAGSSRLLASAIRPLSTSTSTHAVQPNTSTGQYYKITLLRSAIALGSKKKGTLVSLGIHRRMQTVYHPHAPEFAGKILAVKELVKVENVPKEAVRTKTEQRQARKPSRGFVILGGLTRSETTGVHAF
ncbi:hypothetical protein EW145_g1599 [Phellinidium pouzarii]|uniref:Large ribosomal subunit protein uL30m n=1 Tax=Phellinidium pouzarii TaxID=167371 RepID=A0A4S4LE69_9AGAM|nr:hypothetical protein EW145_g1599 [Phellinidium pouzarii]